MPENQPRRIVVNLDQPKPTAPITPPNGRNAAINAPSFGYASEPTGKRRGLFGKILLTLAVVLLVAIAALGLGGYVWWQSFQKSPSYSLALLIAATRKDDKPQVDQLLDTNLVVENFVPQVVESAKNRYGRGFPPQVVERATGMLTPLLPAIKERARTEVPRLIREKLQAVPEVSPAVMALGISRAATIEETGDQATIKTSVQNRDVEIAMQRAGDRWRVVGLKDAVLADKIADTVGQKVLQVVSQRPNAANQSRVTADLIEQVKRQIQQLTP